MITVIPTAERSIFFDPPKVVSVAATATEILPNQANEVGTIAYRLIQNPGDVAIYFTIGQDNGSGNAKCDSTHYHGFIPAGGQLDCSGHYNRVCGFVVGGGGSAATMVGRRK